MFDMNGSTQIIDSSRDGQRIDNFLFTNLKGVPKSLIYRLLRTGKIRVNGKRVKQTYRLQVSDEILIPDLRMPQSRGGKSNIPERIKVQFESSILHEDASILAINKPAGIAVHPGTRVSYGVIEVLRALRPAAPYLELAHRIDRGTSGCLLIAKNKKILNELHELLRTQKINKVYVALLKGEWTLGDTTINTPLQNKKNILNDSDKNHERRKLKTATTCFSVSRIYPNFSLMNVQISTGRTHQIRIHAAQTGHPIAGDQKYGDFSFNHECRKKGLKRMFLHASNISFQLPSSGQKYNISAPLDEELNGFLEGLELNN